MFERFHQTSCVTKIISDNFIFQWTTDEDIRAAIQSIGVMDLIEVKFHENRINGQSKGFCSVSLGSEASSRIIMEKLGKKEIHGMNPVVAYYTKSSLQSVCIWVLIISIFCSQL